MHKLIWAFDIHINPKGHFSHGKALLYESLQIENNLMTWVSVDLGQNSVYTDF